MAKVVKMKEIVRSKRGPGRPKKLTTADVVSIKKALKKKGAKLTGIAAAHKVSVSTLRRNVPDYAEFLHAA